MKMKFFLGQFLVVDTANGVRIDLGKGTYITIHSMGPQPTVKAGDLVPLFTELPIARS